MQLAVLVCKGDINAVACQVQRGGYVGKRVFHPLAAKGTQHDDMTVPPFTQPLCSIVGISIVLYMGQNDHITGGFRLGGRIKIPHDQIRLNAQHSRIAVPGITGNNGIPRLQVRGQSGRNRHGRKNNGTFGKILYPRSHSFNWLASSYMVR